MSQTPPPKDLDITHAEIAAMSSAVTIVREIQRRQRENQSPAVQATAQQITGEFTSAMESAYKKLTAYFSPQQAAMHRIVAKGTVDAMIRLAIEGKLGKV